MNKKNKCADIARAHKQIKTDKVVKLNSTTSKNVNFLKIVARDTHRESLYREEEGNYSRRSGEGLREEWVRNGERKRKAKERHLGSETTAFLVAIQCIFS